MKILSSLCLAVAIACQAAGYYGMYSMGRLGSAWVYLNFFTLDPILFLAVVALVGICLVSLFRRSDTVWSAAMLCGFIASMGLQLYVLPHPRSLVIYGLRNHVMQVCAPDDLRHFARDIHRDIPGITLSNGAADSLSENQAAAYRKLRETYPFLQWDLGPTGGPTIYERGDAINIDWGGPAVGHWGFSVTFDGAKNGSDKGPRAEILRVSDDIYFYHGE
jgi:hypothetical protein